MSPPERCPRCNGRLFLDPDRDLACLACGHRVYLAGGSELGLDRGPYRTPAPKPKGTTR